MPVARYVYAGPVATETSVAVRGTRPAGTDVGGGVTDRRLLHLLALSLRSCAAGRCFPGEGTRTRVEARYLLGGLIRATKTSIRLDIIIVRVPTGAVVVALLFGNSVQVYDL